MSRAHPAWRLTAGLTLFAAGWVALLARLWTTPPIDNVEQLVWRSALEWGYYKHPPLPTWLLAALSPLWPATPALTMVVGALCMVLALLGLHAVVRRLLGPGDALLAVLAVLCLTYSTDRLPIFNHNVVMLPMISGIVWLLWRTTERPSLRAWAAIGVLMGLGLLTKYQMVVVGACVLAWWLRLRGWQDPTQRAGLVLAVLLACALFAPHAVWLSQTGWMPLQYAAESSLGAHLPLAQRPLHAIGWVLDWLGNRLAPAWLLMAAVGALLARDSVRSAAPNVLARDYLLLWGFGPMAAMVLLSLLDGIYLQMKWSTAFALWTVPAVLALLPRRWRCGDAMPPRAAWWLFGGVQALLVAYTLWTTQLAARDPMAAGGWKQRDFGAMAAQIDVPVDVVNGPYGVAGMLAQHLPGRPRVLIDGELAHSPWLTAAELARARTVSVWPTCHAPPGAHTLAPGWAWWPQAEPPPIPPGPDTDREQAMRRAARQTGGTTPVSCP